MVNPTPRRRASPLQQAQAAATPAPGLRRAQRAPISPAPEPRSAAPAPRPRMAERAFGSRETTTSTHVGKSTVSEATRNERLREVPVDPDARGEVKVSHGKTISLGNFEFLRVDVAVTLPCTRDSVPEALAEAHDYVVDGLAAEEEYVLGALAPSRRANRRGN